MSSETFEEGAKTIVESTEEVQTKKDGKEWQEKMSQKQGKHEAEFARPDIVKHGQMAIGDGSDVDMAQSSSDDDVDLTALLSSEPQPIVKKKEKPRSNPIQVQVATVATPMQDIKKDVPETPVKSGSISATHVTSSTQKPLTKLQEMLAQKKREASTIQAGSKMMLIQDDQEVAVVVQSFITCKCL